MRLKDQTKDMVTSHHKLDTGDRSFESSAVGAVTPGYRTFTGTV
jgi:hypothetical protein